MTVTRIAGAGLAKVASKTLVAILPEYDGGKLSGFYVCEHEGPGPSDVDEFYLVTAARSLVATFGGNTEPALMTDQLTSSPRTRTSR